MMRISTVFVTWVLINVVILCTAKKRKNQKGKGKGKKPTVLEGDILVTPELLSEIDELRRTGDGIGVFDAYNRGKWPKGIVPYTIKGKIKGGEPSRLEIAIANAVDEYNDKLSDCITWEEYSESDIKQFDSYVTFFRGQGCYSSLGKQKRPQVISLQVPGCTIKLGTAVHEMMHTLGFFHEQSRNDRDNFITINWDNINRRMRYNFEKYRPAEASTLGEPYDYDSVMHYGQTAFSRNGKQTIKAKYGSSARLGQKKGLSKIDVKQLRKFYNCNAQTTSKKGKKNKKKNKKKRKKRVWCGDQYTNCLSYKAKCDILTVVQKYCKKTCNLCGKRAKKKGSKRKGSKKKVPKKKVPKRKRKSRKKITKVVSSSCADKSSYCKWRQSRGTIYCSSSYMKKYCKKTCDLCPKRSRFSDESVGVHPYTRSGQGEPFNEEDMFE